MTAPVLATRELSKNFGALMVARNIDFALAKGARHALIGPNGAGKTSLINLIAGVLAPSFGAVMLNGDDITRSGQAERVKLGVARTFQINQLFRGLTVLENACLPVAERRGTARVAWRPLAAYPEIAEEALAVLATLESEAEPGDVIMSPDAGAYRYHGGWSGIVTPDDPLETVEDAARQYGVRWLALEGNHITRGLLPVLTGDVRPDWLSEPLIVGPPLPLDEDKPVDEQEPRPSSALYAVCLEPDDTRCGA